MENDVNRTELGSDNESILAANRRKNTSAVPPVNAAQLRAQMQAGHTASSAVKPVTPAAKPAVPAVKPVTPAAKSAVPAAKPVTPAAKSAVPAAKPVTPAAKSAVPAAKPVTPAAKPAVPAAKPMTSAAKPAVPAAKPVTPAAKSAVPAAKPVTPAKSAVSASRPVVAPAAKPAAPAPRRDAGGVPSTIPYQQASAAQKRSPDVGAPTRMTDMSLHRAAAKNNDATRLTDINDFRQAPLVVPEKEPKDESEGGNTIISIIKAITYMVAVLVVSVFLSVFIILVGNDIYAFVKDDSVVEITVPEYATLDDVTDLLYENNIIKYPNIFKLYANIKKDSGEFLAGTYSTLSPMMNYDELLLAFKPKKPTGVSRITIPEGYTTDEIIDLFVSKGIGTREKYVDVINNYPFDYWFIDELVAEGIPEGRYYRLDGYLFPDTYDFYNASTEEVVIGKLLKRFNQVFEESFRVKASELGYSVDEILTLASMIEKEAGGQSDFFNISSVFNNRLRKPASYPYLQSDATIVHAIEHDTGERIKLTAAELDYQSPYNTYMYAGLPPGPIANPSASAIRAALYPADTNYHYFVAASSRLTLFAETQPEHEANIEKIRAGETAAPEETDV